MEADKYKIKKLTDSIYLLYGFPQECCIFVLNGSEKTALIDTGMGTGDLNAALEEIAPGKPRVVVNTHAHVDHCGGNSQFPEVWLHPGAYADADHAEAERDTLPHGEASSDVKHFQWQRRPLREGDEIDLGDRKLEVIETPGHTPGCICLLDRRDRVLFCGDLVGSNDHCTHMLAYVEWFRFSTVSIETFNRSLRKIQALEGDFDYMLGGHDAFPLDKKYLRQLLTLTGAILDGTARAYHPQLPPQYGNIQCWRVDGEDTAILYHDEVIFDKK